MPIAVNCFCGQHYQVRDDFAGKPVRCACGRVVTVPPAGATLEPPSSGPRLRLAAEETPPVPPPAPSGSNLGVILAALFLLLLGGAGFAIAFHFDDLQRLFGTGKSSGVENAEKDKGIEEPKPRIEEPKPLDPPKPLPDPPQPPPQEKPPIDPGLEKPPPPANQHPPFEGHRDSVFRVALSPDGTSVFTAAGGVLGEGEAAQPSLDSTLRYWDARSGQQLKRWDRFPTGIAAAAFSPGGRLALLAGAGKRDKDQFLPGADLDLHLWDLRDSKEIQTLNGHRGEVFCIAFSPDGKNAYSGGRDKIVRVWEIPSGREINRLVGHSNSINGITVSPDGQHALSCGSDQSVRYWELKRGVEARSLAGHQDIVWAVAISPDGRQAVSGGGYQTGPEGKGLVAGNKDFAIRLWDLTNGKELRRFEGHTEAVSALAFTPDGKRVISTGADRTVRVWQTASGRQIHILTGHTKLIQSLAITPDGRRAITGAAGGELKAWDLPLEVPDLIRVLREEKGEALVKATQLMGYYGIEARDAVPDLLRLAANGDEALRKTALASLVMIGKPRPDHLPLLEPLLQATAPNEVRGYILETLAALGPEAKPILESIAALLRDPDAELRTRAIRTLATLGVENRNAIQPLLVVALRDTEEKVAKAAREALTTLGPAKAGDVKPLTTWLRDTSESVRRYALESLTSLKQEALPAVPDVMRVALEDRSPTMRRQALQALAAIAPREKETLEAFQTAFKDKERANVLEAIQAVVQSGPEASLPALLLALDHADAQVVKAVSDALTATKWEKDHAKFVGEALLSATAAGRTRLLEILAGLKTDAEDAVPSLREAIKRAEPKDALPFVQALSKIGPGAKSAAMELIPLLKRDPKMKDDPLPLETAHVLVEIEAVDLMEAVNVLVSAIKVEGMSELELERRDKAMKALVKVGKPAIPRLLKSIEGEYYVGAARTPVAAVRAIARYKIIEVLAAMGQKVAATPEVLKMLTNLERSDLYLEVRQVANQARMALTMKPEEPPKEKEG